MKDALSKRGTGFKALAAHLVQLIGQSTSPFLPSFREMSSRFNASLHTINRAVHLLQKQGIVEIRRGKYVRILAQSGAGFSPSQKQPAQVASAAEELKNLIREDISRGVYRCGDIMPKFAHFVLTMRAASDTVSAAFKMLNSENLIHKSSKRWIVGGRQTAERQTIANIGAGCSEEESPALVVLFEDLARWNVAISSEFHSPFMFSFFAQTEKCGFVCRMAQLKKFCAIADKRYPSGEANILECIRKLGKRYAGILLQLPYGQEYVNYNAFLSRLCSFGKPVIVADIANYRSRLNRRTVGAPNYFRCFMDERKAVAMAFDALQRTGHTGIGIPGVQRPDGPPAWYPQRLAFIRASAAAMEPKFDIHLEKKESNPWDEWKPFEEPVLLKNINAIQTQLHETYPAESEAQIISRLRKRLIAMAPAFMKLVAQPRLTALLAPNQWVGICCWHWLVNIGISIPRDLSIVMFDNFARFRHIPVSTIDFGLELLGYKVAHVFIGDIPIHADRYGNIASEPFFCDRGSLAPRRKNSTLSFHI